MKIFHCPFAVHVLLFLISLPLYQSKYDTLNWAHIADTAFVDDDDDNYWMLLCFVFFKGWALCQAWLQKRPCWNWTVSYVKYIPHAALLFTCFQKFFMNLFRQEVWILNPHLFKNERKICQKLLHHLHYHVQHSYMTLNATLCFCFWRYKRGGNVVIFREIHAENNQSLWMLNDRQCSQKAVEEEVKALRIQVSNLCQFLPQVCLCHCNIKLHRCSNM